jgi:hypothetical protein
MSDEQRSQAWYDGYGAYMNDREYRENPYRVEGQLQNSCDWADGYLEAQYEVETGDDDVA